MHVAERYDREHCAWGAIITVVGMCTPGGGIGFATRSDVFNFCNFDTEAPWSKTLLSMQEYLCQCEQVGKQPSVWVELEGFVLARSLRDSFHCWFHQGIASDFGGSLAFQLASSPDDSGWKGADICERLGDGFDRYCAWEVMNPYYTPLASKTHRCKRWCRRSLVHYTWKCQPRFSDQYKAAHVRLFCMFFCEEILRIFRALATPSRYDSIRADTCLSFCKCWRSLKIGGPVLTEEQASIAQECGH